MVAKGSGVDLFLDVDLNAFKSKRRIYECMFLEYGGFIGSIRKQ